MTMDAPDKLTEWKNIRQGCIQERDEIYQKVKDFDSASYEKTERAILAMEELNSEIRHANGVIKRMLNKKK